MYMFLEVLVFTAVDLLKNSFSLIPEPGITLQ